MGAIGARRDPVAPVPISLQQECFWVTNRLMAAHGGLAYNVRCDLRLRRRVEDAVVEAAVAAVARRHQILRTVFRDVDGRAQQFVVDAVPDLRLVDATGSTEPEDEAQRIADEELAFKFSLVTAPPWRAVLVRTSAEEARLIVTLHHIVADGWSVRILDHELALLIAAGTGEGEGDLPHLPVQYADYAAWQAETVRGPELERQLAYWLDHLENIPLGLAADAARKLSFGTGTGRLRFRIPEETAAGLARSCRAQRATEFAGLLSAFRVALHRWAPQEDIVVSTAILGRGRPELTELVGCFFNSVALRFRRTPDDHAGAITETRRSVLQAVEHPDVPIDLLLRHLWLEEFARGNTRQPVIEAGYQHEEVLSHSPVDWIDQSPPVIPRRDGPSGLSLYTKTGTARGIDVTLLYSAAVGSERARELAHRFGDAVGAIARSPSAPVPPAPSAPRADGRIAFRGLWIDAHGMEAALSRHPAVERVAVGAAGSDGEVLVAWVVVRNGRAAPAPDEVRRLLEEEEQWVGLLPAVQAVDELPRNRTRAGVNVPAAPPPRPSAPPASREELRVAAIFERVLGRAPLSVGDHAFELGGDLLSANRIVELARQEGFRVDRWDLPDLTVAGLVAAARSTTPERDEGRP